MTPLHAVLKRSVMIGRQEYVLTLTPDRMKLTLKGKRNGIELRWAELIDGDAALAIALRASVGAIDQGNGLAAGKQKPKKERARPLIPRPAARTRGRVAKRRL